MKRVVVDASVILKWVLGDRRETDHEKAMDLLDAWVDGRVEVFAPTLWEYEVGNFLGRELPEQATQKMSLLRGLGIVSLPLNEKMHALCFSWMKQNGVTFYDAAYLAAAVETGGILITADSKLSEKMRHMESIRLLSDL
ncbi:MAG: type II toxin-antitoxin system VapC family toxin [Syntrophobacteraceae bacterium]|nr:type II toxin-antitoxin system VapC family toxin [Syntrophobacteraceae bacterium]